MLKGVQRKRADKYWEYTFKVSYSHPQKISHVPHYMILIFGRAYARSANSRGKTIYVYVYVYNEGL
jgi:hypothetical protein